MAKLFTVLLIASATILSAGEPVVINSPEDQEFMKLTDEPVKKIKTDLGVIDKTVVIKQNIGENWRDYNVATLNYENLIQQAGDLKSFITAPINNIEYINQKVENEPFASCVGAIPFVSEETTPEIMNQINKRYGKLMFPGDQFESFRRYLAGMMILKTGDCSCASKNVSIEQVMQFKENFARAAKEQNMQVSMYDKWDGESDTLTWSEVFDIAIKAQKIEAYCGGEF